MSGPWTTRLTVLALVASLGLAGAGCTAGPDGSADDAGPADAAPDVRLASADDLASLLPSPEGWARGEVDRGAVGLPAPAAHASVSYLRDAARIDMDITDTAGQPDYIEATAGIAGTSFNRDSENGYMRGATVAGAPAIESWNHVDRLAEITVLVDGRFVVHASASGLEDIAALRDVITLVDFARLSSLTPR